MCIKFVLRIIKNILHKITKNTNHRRCIMYKKLIISIASIVCTILIAYTVIISTDSDNDTTEDKSSIHHKIPADNDITSADTDITGNSSETSVSDIRAYEIQSKDNKLNIYQMYSNGYKELIQSVDINTSVLPEKDIIQLNEGIITKSYDEVCSLIEDFSS